MKTRLMLMLVALLLAIVGTSAVYAYVNRADARAVSGVQTATAYVAAHTVSAGTSLHDALSGHLVVRETLPRKTVPVDAVKDVSAHSAALVATSDIPAGTLLLTAAFGKQAVVTGGLPIPHGKMAVSVALEDPQRVGGFVKPGSDIAVFDTYNTVVGFNAQGDLQSGNRTSVAGDGLADSHLNNRATKLLLPRARVLGVGASVATPQTLHQSGQADTGQKAASDQVVIVTLAVTQIDAQKLIEAIQTGHLYLALLTQDSQVAPGDAVDSTTLFK
jgi:pilus assembly protein CpaB